MSVRPGAGIFLKKPAKVSENSLFGVLVLDRTIQKKRLTGLAFRRWQSYALASNTDKTVPVI
jgi:hypothetical protein